MLRIPLRFRREFTGNLRNVCEGYTCDFCYPTHCWSLRTLRTSVCHPNLNINMNVDMFGLVTDDPVYMNKLKRWVRKKLGEEDLQLKNKFAYLFYAVTDGKKAAPLWNVWGGTLVHGCPRYNNRQYEMTVRSDGRITREYYELDAGNQLSFSVFDRYYQAGGVWITLYNTMIHLPKNTYTRCDNPMDEEQVMPRDFNSLSADVMFLRDGHVCVGELIVDFNRNQPYVSYKLHYTDTAVNEGCSKGGMTNFGPVPRNPHNGLRYKYTDIIELIHAVLSRLFPDILQEELF